VTATSFEDQNIFPAIRQGLSDLGYQQLLDVQVACLEPLRQGRSLGVRSRTGTGKTAAFGIPLLERIDPESKSLALLILTPTRELATQVATELTAIGRHHGIKVVSALGGAPIADQIRDLRAGSQVVVGTPGRVLDLIRRNVLRLEAVKMVVLDEADEMLSMGFLEDVSYIMDGCKNCSQVVILSASLSPETERLINKYAPDVEWLDLSTDQMSVDGIENIYYEINDDLPKHHYLLHVLEVEKPTSAIIFVNTRSDASILATLLAREGYNAEMISSELPQPERERVMASIRQGELRFLVATDISARGIDISHLSHVINYSLPQDPILYLHRVGRTGRAGRSGSAISLVSGRELRAIPQLRQAFGVDFTKRIFPRAGEMTQSRNRLQLDSLIEAAGAAICDGFVDQAQTVLVHPQALQIVSYLLKRQADQVHDEQRNSANRPQKSPIRHRPERPANRNRRR